MKAMASSVEKRYISADAMLADLEEFRKNPNISFDYTTEDLLVGEGDEPTQPIGANTPQTVPHRPAHTERYEEQKSGKGSKSGKLPKVGKGAGKVERPVKKQPRPEPEEDDDDYDEGGSGIGILVVVAAVVLCLVGVGVFLWTNVFSGMMDPGEVYTVPSVLGYTLEEAQALPEVVDNGFTVVEGRHVVSDMEPGLIVSQSPKAEDVVKAGGQTITVEISTGGEGLKMPDVYNQDQRVAESSLRALGLVPKVENGYSDSITKGNVMSQSPAKDETVEEGQEVTIVVSQGRKLQEMTMITVVNMTLEDATKALTDMGLRVGAVKPVSSEQYEEGKVCSQSVLPNSIVMEETVIDLEISTGIVTVDPPEVTESPAPGESAEPAPSETPAPSAPAAQTSRRDVTVNLPNDRETVTVRITVGGVEQVHDQVVETRMRMARFTVEASGVQQIVVYLDGVSVKEYTEDFGT